MLIYYCEIKFYSDVLFLDLGFLLKSDMLFAAIFFWVPVIYTSFLGDMIYAELLLFDKIDLVCSEI